MRLAVVASLCVLLSSAAATLQIAPGLPFSGTYLAPKFGAFGVSNSVTKPLLWIQTPDMYAALCAGGLSAYHVEDVMIGYVRVTSPTARWPLNNVTYGCPIDQLVANCMEANCAGLIMLSDNDPSRDNTPDELGLQEWWSCRNCSYISGKRVTFPVVMAYMGNYSQPGWNNPNISAFSAYLFAIGPVVLGTVSVAEAEAAYNISISNFVIPVTLTPDESPFVVLANSYGVAFQVIFSVWSGVLVIMSVCYICVQVIASERAGGKFPEVAVSVLALECVQNLLRLGYVAGDPLWFTTVYPGYISLFFVSAGFGAFSLMASFVIAVFWFRISTGVSAANDPMHQPGVVTILIAGCLIIFVALLVPSLIRVFYPVSRTAQMLFVTGLIASIIYFLISLYFIISGVVLQVALHRSSGIRTKGNSARDALLRFLVVDSIFMLLLSGASLMTLSSNFLLTMPGWYSTLSLMWLFSMCVSTTQIVVFAIRLPSATSAKGKSDQRTPNSVLSSNGVRSSESPLSMTDSSSPLNSKRSPVIVEETKIEPNDGNSLVGVADEDLNVIDL